VAALLTMGVSTVVIGLLPTYATIGTLAPLLLALCRFGQGLGLGGEWGGAVLLATENAPPGKKAWYGMFPQLGAPIGFILSTLSFIILTAILPNEQFLSWGWRVPFIASSLLVIVGLWVRLRITETPEFKKTIDKAERVETPILTLLARHKFALLTGTLAGMATFVLFYLMTVFALGWGTTAMGYTREQFLPIQLLGVCFFGLFIPLAALAADRWGQGRTLLVTSIAIALFGLVLAPLFGSGGRAGVVAFFIIGFSLMGCTYGPLGAALARPFPTAVRYTGASMTFNLAGILGASLAPFAATWLAGHYGLQAVGAYLAVAAVLTILALLGMNRIKTDGEV
jgi:MFS family permease